MKEFHEKTDINPFQAGRRPRQLLESEIRMAQDNARSEMEASRLLAVSYNTYKKYAKLFGLFGRILNPGAVGIPKIFGPRKSKYQLDEILKGNVPYYDKFRLKQRLLRENYFAEKCENCGFEERRITDQKVPLIMDFVNGKRDDYRRENLRFLCFNCSFLLVGNITGRKRDYIY